MDCYTNNCPGLPSLKKFAADKHVIAELPLVPFVIINLTRLTVGVCMKVRFKSKVTRGFSLSPLRDSRSPLRGSLTWEKSRKTSGTRVPALLNQNVIGIEMYDLTKKLLNKDEIRKILYSLCARDKKIPVLESRTHNSPRNCRMLT